MIPRFLFGIGTLTTLSEFNLSLTLKAAAAREGLEREEFNLEDDFYLGGPDRKREGDGANSISV